MGRPAGLFYVEDRLAGLSRRGDDWSASRPWSTSSCSAPNGCPFLNR